jgi:hypothetical protein
MASVEMISRIRTALSALDEGQGGLDAATEGVDDGHAAVLSEGDATKVWPRLRRDDQGCGAGLPLLSPRVRRGAASVVRRRARRAFGGGRTRYLAWKRSFVNP